MNAKRLVLATVFGAAVIALNGLAIAHYLRGRPGPVGPSADPEAERFEVRPVPLEIRPYTIPDLVTPAELAAVLATVEPRFDPSILAGRIPTPLLVHSARLWGASARFGDRGRPSDPAIAYSGEYLLSTLLDNRLYERRTSIFGTYLLARSTYGIQVVTAEDLAGETFETMTHMGQLSKVLADAGVPADRRAVTREGYAGTVADILRDDAARVRAGAELEFVTAGLSRYAAGPRPWANRFGQRVSFDELCGRLMDQPGGVGACSGLHAPYALVMVLRSDAASPLVGPATRGRLNAYFAGLSARLERAQNADGSWDLGWHDPEHHKDAGRTEDRDEELFRRLIATGHSLEWIAFAPPGRRPSDGAVRRAVRFLVAAWPAIAAQYDQDWHTYMPTSHAARAVRALSGIALPQYAPNRGD
jgi:hypothetical protein